MVVIGVDSLKSCGEICLDLLESELFSRQSSSSRKRDCYWPWTNRELIIEDLGIKVLVNQPLALLERHLVVVAAVDDDCVVIAHLWHDWAAELLEFLSAINSVGIRIHICNSMGFSFAFMPWKFGAERLNVFLEGAEWENCSEPFGHAHQLFICNSCYTYACDQKKDSIQRFCCHIQWPPRIWKCAAEELWSLIWAPISSHYWNTSLIAQKRTLATTLT